MCISSKTANVRFRQDKRDFSYFDKNKSGERQREREKDERKDKKERGRKRERSNFAKYRMGT